MRGDQQRIAFKECEDENHVIFSLVNTRITTLDIKLGEATGNWGRCPLVANVDILPFFGASSGSRCILAWGSRFLRLGLQLLLFRKEQCLQPTSLLALYNYPTDTTKAK